MTDHQLGQQCKRGWVNMFEVPFYFDWLAESNSSWRGEGQGNSKEKEIIFF